MLRKVRRKHTAGKAIRVAAPVSTYSRVERAERVVRVVVGRVVLVVDELVVPVRATPPALRTRGSILLSAVASQRAEVRQPPYCVGKRAAGVSK